MTNKEQKTKKVVTLKNSLADALQKGCNPQDCLLLNNARISYAFLTYPQGFLAWQKQRQQKYFSPFVPFFVLSDEEGEIYRSEDFFKTLPPTAAAQWRKFFFDIPLELRQLTSNWGRYQWLLIEATHHFPAFKDFLKQEAKNQSYHYAAAVLLTASAYKLSLEKRLTLYNEMMWRERVEFLSALLDLPCEKKIFSLLAKFSVNEMDAELIAILYHFSHEIKLFTALQNFTKLNKRVISMAYYELPDWLITASVLSALFTVPVSIVSLEAVFPPMVLNAEGSRRKQVLMSLKSVKNYHRLENKLAELTQKFLLASDFPPAPFAGNEFLQAIQTGEELKKEGLRMHNCVAGYAEAVASGESYFYHWWDRTNDAQDKNKDKQKFSLLHPPAKVKDQEATVQLQKSQQEIWYLKEHLGFANKGLKQETVLKIMREVAVLMKGNELSLRVCKLAGLQYYHAAKLWPKLHLASRLLLVREKENPYDSKAVAVFYRKDQTENNSEAEGDLLQIGYIPRIYNDLISYLMDIGEKLSVKILSLDVQEHYHVIRVRVSLVGKKAR